MDCLLFLKGNILTSGPELDMIWTERTGSGKVRQKRRRMLRTAEALLRIPSMLEDLEIRIWNMLVTPPQRPLGSIMATNQRFKDDLQLVQMAFGLEPIKDYSWLILVDH